jgi:hypothetical protein
VITHSDLRLQNVKAGHNCGVRRIHGLAVTSLLAGLLGLVLVVLVLPASAVPVPASYLTLYRQAARTCPGLTWEVLAGIGTVESGNGQSRARGVHRGKNHKGAEGPMQFEPATFAEYAVRADRTARLSPYDPADAVFTAARMLCADGAANGRPGLRRAIYAYNHACWYVRNVLALAAQYAGARKPHPLRTGFCAVHHRKHGHGRPHHSRAKGHAPGRAARHGRHHPHQGRKPPKHGKPQHGKK